MKNQNDYFDGNVIKEEKPAVDISKDAYEVSSELFNFKDFRRGVIEHGKTCYIEGYKKHSELYANFLIKYGYFTPEELNKIDAEFDAYLNATPCISIRYVEDTLKELYKRTGSKIDYLYDCQKDIVQLYKHGMTNDKHLLIIQTPRQRGITAVLTTIAYIEAMNGKKVCYMGFEPRSRHLSMLANVDYHKITEGGSVEIPGKRYDLIIVDEITFQKDPLMFMATLNSCLKKDGRMIISLTPRRPGPDCNQLRDFRNMMYGKGVMEEGATENLSRETEVTIFPPQDNTFGRIYCKVLPTEWAKAQVRKYPEMRNEFLGEFID